MQRLIIFVGIALMGVFSISEASQVCWKLAPFSDVLQASIEEVSDDAFPAPLLFRLHLRWIGFVEDQEPLYQQEGAGTFARRLGVEMFGMNINAGHDTEFFAGSDGFPNRQCHLYASLNTQTVSGPYRIACTGAHIANGQARLNRPFVLPQPGAEDPSVFQLIFDPTCAALEAPLPIEPGARRPALPSAAGRVPMP